MRKFAVLSLMSMLGLAMTGAALAQSRDFDLNGFERIDISTGIDARVRLGDSFSIVAQSKDQRALDNLEVSVDSGVLSARLDQNFIDFIIGGGVLGQLLTNGNAVSFDITLPTLTSVISSAGASVDVSGVTAASLELNAWSGADISGSDITIGALIIKTDSGGDVEVSGTADRVALDASGGGDIDAENLIAKTATAKASSGANLSVHATQSIKANASSGGDIDISGNPGDRTIDSSSGGDVRFDD